MITGTVGSDEDCNNIVENVNGSGGRAIKYYNYSVTLQNEDFSCLILCNADYSNISDINVLGSSAKTNNGIYIWRSFGINLTNINSSYNRYGIYGFGVENSSFTNITANDNYVALGSGHRGIYCRDCDDSNFTDITTDSNRWGFQFYSSVRNNVRNLTANSNDVNGIFLNIGSDNNNFVNVTANYNSDSISDGAIELSASDGNTFTDTTLSSNRHIAIYYASSGSNTFRDLTIYNCSSTNEYCLYVSLLSAYNVIENAYINLSENHGIRIDGSSSGNRANHNLFKDIVIENIDDYDVFLDDYAKNTTFLNATFNSSKARVDSTDCELIRKWYYKAYVNNTNGDDVGGAQVEAYNSSDVLIENLTTNSTGWTPTGSLIEYVNSSGTTYYYSNYTVNASKTNYITGTKEHNITVSQNIMDDNFELTQSTSIVACGVLYNANTVYTQSANIEPDWNEDPCINITAQNVTFDGNGFWISNTSLAGTGIYSNQYNTTIQNSNVTMKKASGGFGIELAGANNSYVNNFPGERPLSRLHLVHRYRERYHERQLGIWNLSLLQFTEQAEQHYSSTSGRSK
jgi:parallel beta-helix repeat protein